jgi:hypothetical protein
VAIIAAFEEAYVDIELFIPVSVPPLLSRRFSFLIVVVVVVFLLPHHLDCYLLLLLRLLLVLTAERRGLSEIL